jgi:SNF2 family DNA or RNA helicase
MLWQSVEDADGIQRKGLVLSMLMQLKQICNHPAQYLHQIEPGSTFERQAETERSGKLARLGKCWKRPFLLMIGR